MKYLIILLSIAIIGCEEGAQESADVTLSKPSPVILGQDLAELEDGDYVKGGSANGFNDGDILDIDGNSYKRAYWVNGQAFIEEGTITFTQEIVIEEMPGLEADIHTKYNYIIFSPTSYSPSNCGYSFNEYEQSYVYESNGEVITQYADIDDNRWVMAFDWPLTVEWADDNLTKACL